MKKIKPSVRTLKDWIKEEKAAHKMYERYGFPFIARQEAGHARRLEKFLKLKEKTKRRYKK